MVLASVLTVGDELRSENNVIRSVDLAQDDTSFRERQAERVDRILHAIVPPSELLGLEGQVERVRSLVVVNSEKRLRRPQSARLVLDGKERKTH